MRVISALLVAAAFSAAVLAHQPASEGAAVEAPTFARDVAPILFKHCTSCHRPGQMAPMSLLTYDSARPWARSIQRQVTSKVMPPWGADPKIGTFVNNPSLTADEIATITNWVSAGAPRGADPAPTPPAYTDGWQIGTPDLVLSIPKPFPIPARGEVDYQYIEIPTGLGEDQWIEAIEIRPTNRKAVHHALAFVRAPNLPTPPPVPRGDGTSCNEDFCGDIEMHDARMGPILAASAVGTNPEIYPEGTAKLLRAGSIITLQIHYTPYGEASTDQIGVGIVFAKHPPRIRLRMVPFSKQGFTIPARAANHVVESYLEFKKDASIWSIGPHAHLRNKSWRFELVDPDGHTQPLLSVPRFDFNWQLVYRMTTPIQVRAGSRLHAIGVFDNSANNKSNPDPNADVHWGNQTYDEMLFASIVYSLAPPKRQTGR
ncbi:MAG: cytochrome c, partial [Acidobacteriota bacterium]|nr:cytochrome c [Acidobacteriota bacterium]